MIFLADVSNVHKVLQDVISNSLHSINAAGAGAAAGGGGANNASNNSFSSLVQSKSLQQPQLRQYNSMNLTTQGEKNSNSIFASNIL